jgi:hypothetical protein
MVASSRKGSPQAEGEGGTDKVVLVIVPFNVIDEGEVLRA